MRLVLPNVLHNSVDFSTFEAMSNIVMCAMKSKVDKITNIRDAAHCPSNMLSVLCESFGCPYYEDAPQTTRKLLNSWWNFMRSKGTLKTMEAVASLAVEVLYEQYSLTPVSGSFDVSIDISAVDRNHLDVSYQGIQPSPTLTTAELNDRCEALIEELLSYVAPVCSVIGFAPSVIATVSDVLEAVEAVSTVELPLDTNEQLIVVSRLDLESDYRICYGQHNLPNCATVDVADEAITGTVSSNTLTIELTNTNILDNSISITLGQTVITNIKSAVNPYGNYIWNSNDIVGVSNADNVVTILFKPGATITTSATCSWKYSVRYVCASCPILESCKKLTKEGVGVAEDSVLDGVNRVPDISWEYPEVTGNTLYIPQSYNITQVGDKIYIE